MSRPSRNQPDIDYKIAGASGRRVLKDRGTKPIMDTLHGKTVDSCSDVDDFLSSYTLDELSGEEELQDFVTKVEILKRDFRRVHSQIQDADKEGFPTKYPYYTERLNELTQLFKDANTKLSNLRKLNKANEDMRELKRMNFESDKEKMRSRSDRIFFMEQACWQLDDCKWGDMFDLEEIKSHISAFESRLDKFYKICSDLEVWFGPEVDALGYRNENEKLISNLRETIVAGRCRYSGVRLEQERIESERLEHEANEKLKAETKRLRQAQLEEEAKIRETLSCAESHSYEIKMRSQRLLKKCEQDLSALSDYEVLDIKKGEENLNVELRELIDKVSCFEQLVMPCRELANTLRFDVLQRRDSCTEALDEFLKKLHKVIKDRDISERKLKNSAGLKIELKKFKGYESEMDIYTFRSSFKKLIEPNVQETMLADILKKNYLAGAAQTLVFKIEEIDEIWKKLTEVYGDARLMLQNKLSSLGKISSFEKLKKDDEKIASNIMHLLNLISDLAKLATDYGLESELYHGPGLNKILDIMGKEHERKFIKSIALENISNRVKWTKLVGYLKCELKIREAYILNEKVRKCALDPNDNLRNEKPKNNDAKKDGSPGVVALGKSIGSSALTHFGNSGSSANRSPCFLCGKTEDHIQSTDGSGKLYVEYVACSQFVEKKPKERDQWLFRKRLCGKCLKPGVRFNAKHDCDTQYVCGQKFTNKQGVESKCSKHVLVCGFHCEEKHNLDLLELYKKNVILSHGNFLDFTKKVSISCFSGSYTTEVEHDVSEDHSIFSFQLIDVAGLGLCLFYDNGCGNAVFSKRAIDALVLLGRAEQTYAKSIILKGVNNQESICPYGEWRVRLPLKDGSEAVLTGICVDEVTETFPEYPLGLVEDDFRSEFGNSPDNHISCPLLPKLPSKIGGKVDIMIGSQYLKHFPREVGRLESGLTLYRSLFHGADGTDGIISGPHPSFTSVNRASHFSLGSNRSYYSSAVCAYFDYLEKIRDVTLLGFKEPLPNPDPVATCFDDDVESEFGDPVCGEGALDSDRVNISFMCVRCRKCDCHDVYLSKRSPKGLKTFEEIEKAGTDISYRCIDCRDCKECKRSSRVEEISIEEEVGQSLINKSVTVDTKKKCSTATLPFTADPDTRLVTNKASSLKVFNSQIRRLNKSDVDLKDALKAEGKLQDLGFVDWLHNLDQETQDMIQQAPVMHFIPWHMVRSGSITTPVRPVFNASAKTPSGYSLNDILPKGTNNMNNLIDIIIRWSVKVHGYHTDVRKMYNTIMLEKKFWRYQLYWWSPNLALDEQPLIKIIKSCIYGVKSSGNQAERALRLVAEKMASKYPLAQEVINRDVYVDDCVSGEDTEEQRDIAIDQLIQSVSFGGFSFKGVTCSGEDPSSELSEDGKSIMVGGQRWFPKEDYLVLNVGKVSERFKNVDKLSVNDCASIAAQVFDPTGKVMPIVASIKWDNSQLHRMGLTWGELIPENLRGIWKSHLEMIQELGTLKYNRVIVPSNAKSLEITTLDTGDASPQLICTATYARFECTDGTYSCQLVFARSKVVPEGTSVPRAELIAAVTNAATGFTVEKAFGSYHKNSLKISDSMVALHWIACSVRRLKQFVRTLVIEINRLCDVSKWRYVESSKMPADLGTRKGATIADVDQNSEWINGKPWMRDAEEDFPTRTVEDIKLDQQDLATAEKEEIILRSFHSRKPMKFEASSFDKIQSRYEFSKYLVDPNRHAFRKVVRILALVLTFISKAGRNIPKVQNMSVFSHRSPGELPEMLKPNLDKYVLTTGSPSPKLPYICKGGHVVILTDEMLTSAFFHYALKASIETKHFLDKSKYENISKEIDGVLYYSGRILPEQQFEGYPDLCASALDLCRTSFCVPVMDQYSPVAIAIAIDVHWNHPDVKHRGVAAIYRQMLKISYVIGGFDLATSVKQGCKKCRALYKKSIDVAMGPIQGVNLCIAPAFYATQVDIFGPFKSYSSANKRATIKVWFLIFCCCTTGAVDIRVLEDYSTDAFVLGFIRFSCRVGYPRYLLPDAGSQLVKGCEDMSYSFVDAKQKLFVEHGVDYIPCPVGAHYTHGKVERKIREVKKSVSITIQNEKLSVVQWESLMAQIGNSMNNMPIGIRSKVSNLEELDLITPNRLILGRNNDRSGNSPLIIVPDHKKMIESNADIFRAWFEAWLVSYVPTLIERSKWFKTDKPINVGDIVLFLKSEREYDLQYQYGIVSDLKQGRDGRIRKVTVEYQNYNENVKRTTERGTRDLVIISPIDELDLYESLNQLYENCENLL